MTCAGQWSEEQTKVNVRTPVFILAILIANAAIAEEFVGITGGSI
jgi:hypothetical protein